MPPPASPGHFQTDTATVRCVVGALGLGVFVRAAMVRTGLMNRTWRVTTDRGDWAVKEVIDVTVEQARRQHQATAALADRGLPVPVPVAAGDDTVVTVNDAVYAALPWVAGEHRDGLDLSITEAQALGALLAKLHLALTEVMPPTSDRLVVPVTDPETAHRTVDRYLALIAAKATRDEFDAAAQAELHRRRRLLDRLAAHRPTGDVAVSPCGWTHGDFQHLNLLWQSDRVSAVLDWDRLDVRPLGLEVVRSATLLFGYGDTRGLDLDRVTAFATGYRTANP
jgi:homoserine kinase type II